MEEDVLAVTIGKNIMRLRRMANMTQLELAEKINYSDKSVSKWEQGNGIPDVRILVQLADLFNVSVGDLVREHTETAVMPKKTRLLRRIVTMILSVGLCWLVAVVCFVFIGIGAPAYTRAGIVIAMIFVGIPFVVRSIQPVLEKVDHHVEEAAFIMGASPSYIFRKVIFPEICPSMLVGFGLAFARSIGEYGSVVFIAGNKPYETEIAPLLIMSELQEYDYASATAIALALLIIAFLILLLMNLIQANAAKRAGER